jgi:uncharacterized protein (TIGR02186 family)
MRRGLAIVCLVLLAVAAGPAARAQESQDELRPATPQLIADLSNHLIAITSDFTGTDLLVFGAVDGEGDILIVVRGPRDEAVVRRKSQVFGIWLNTKSVSFANTPGFYAVASTQPLDQLGADDVLRLHEIGVENLKLQPDADVSPEELDEFRNALIALKQREGLYSLTPAHIDVVGGRLFRATVAFPSETPVGTYIADVFLVQNGVVVAAQSSPLLVSKVGFGAEVFDFAHDESSVYGLFAVVAAMMAGFLGNLLFRRP